MLSHEAIWAAIDALAAKHKLTPSALARRSNLDPTSFNKSKRTTAAGRQRWPSTESIAKALRATHTSLDEFMVLVQQNAGTSGPGARAGRAASQNSYRTPVNSVPLLGLAQAGVGGFFDDGGYPAGQGWDEVTFPLMEQGVYALKVNGDSMLPVYRDGDVIIVLPGASVHAGDRVVVRTREGEVMAKVLARKTASRVELQSLNPEHPGRELESSAIDWIARIIWASQ